MSARRRIIVSGMVAGDPRQGGATWAVLQYALGLRRLGHDVTLVEPLRATHVEPGVAAYFDALLDAFDLRGRAALTCAGSGEVYGMDPARLGDATRGADLLINVAGMLADPAILSTVPVRLYLDLDPVFVQLWHTALHIDMRLAGHTHHATVGLNLGAPDCPIPDCGFDWFHTLPPVVLDAWPAATVAPPRPWTTVANWRGYGSIDWNGAHYGQKAHSFRAWIDLPRRSGEAMDVALAIHPDETKDLVALRENGWGLLDPSVVAGTPADYRRFVSDSFGEIGIAKSGYVAGRSGWFSDRSACYLAAGRPVVAQDTGIGKWLPTGEGLFTCSTPDEAIDAMRAVRGEYARHARRSREIAVEFLDSDRVLRRLLDHVEVG